MFETLVNVAYVLLAVLLNKYEERELVKAYLLVLQIQEQQI